MRKEMAEYARCFPENCGWRRWLRDAFEELALRWFRWRIRNLHLGSPKWHKLQEKLSQGSAVGIEVKRRNVFYEDTMRGGCAGIHTLPNVAIYYPQNVKLGKCAFLNRGVYIIAPEKICFGDNVLVGPFVVINSGNHRYHDASNLIRSQGHKLAPIHIDDDVWIGSHAVIMPGVKLGRGCVVAAGAIVTKSVAPNTVVAGVAAQIVIATREPASPLQSNNPTAS
jgi:acetyltransferase-like isoleucine patch superfamily enzyme